MMGKKKRKSVAAKLRERRREGGPLTVVGNVMILGMFLGFGLAALTMVAWWAWTVYGLIGMKAFFRPAEATILSSKVVRHEDREDGDTWEVRLRYRYEVNGRQYEGYRLNPSFGGGFSLEDSARQVVNALPPGKTVTVRYDPLMPSQSALTSELYNEGFRVGPSATGGIRIEGGGQAAMLFFVPAFFLFGIGIIWYYRRKFRYKASKREKRPLLVRLREFLVTPRGESLDGSVTCVCLLAGLAFAGPGVWIITTAFTPREPSQISMGSAGQCLFGSIFFLLGCGVIGFMLSSKAHR